jgi:hypothetical protein
VPFALIAARRLRLSLISLARSSVWFSSTCTSQILNILIIEDGVIYGVGEEGVLAFTDFGIESLIELIKM